VSFEGLSRGPLGIACLSWSGQWTEAVAAILCAGRGGVKQAGIHGQPLGGIAAQEYARSRQSEPVEPIARVRLRLGVTVQPGHVVPQLRVRF
jgi:hypothetical protein